MTPSDPPADLAAALEEIARLRTELARLRSGALPDCITDAATGLKNRAYFDMIFMDEQRRAHREGRTLTLLLAEVDGFASFVSRRGERDAGTALRQVAAIFRDALNRPGDLSFRTGDQAFVCLFVTSVERESMELAERIRAQLQDAAIADADNAHGVLTMSLGLAFLRPDNEEALEQACQRAQLALAQARGAGGNMAAR